MTQESVSICCQRESEGFVAREYQYQTVLSFVLHHLDERNNVDEPMSETDKSSPLAFLASVGLAFKDSIDGEAIAAKWNTSLCEGKERITVVPGPSGISIRLHKGNGRLPPMDLTKPFARKCRNRECNNLGGQLGKPRSIYCSKRCQSREQNLRQGRIKNVRSPTPTNLGSKNRSGSPRSSPSPVSMGNSGSPVPMTGPVVSPSMGLISTTSPLTLRPSPISISPGPNYSNSFSPIPMSSSIPSGNHLSTPILLPRPTQPSLSGMPSTQFTTKPSPTAVKPTPLSNPGSLSTSSFTPANSSSQKKFESMESLTLAPILSKS